MKKSWHRWMWLLLVGAVIVNELRKTAEERTWNDRLLGVLPYDLRPPTRARVKLSLWNVQSTDVFVPHAFGIGWSINVAGLLRRVGLVGSE